jgi:hypothetical protein
MNYLTLIWFEWFDYKIFNNILHNNHKSTFMLVQSLTYMHGMHDIISMQNARLWKHPMHDCKVCKGMIGHTKITPQPFSHYHI